MEDRLIELEEIMEEILDSPEGILPSNDNEVVYIIDKDLMERIKSVMGA